MEQLNWCAGLSINHLYKLVLNYLIGITAVECMWWHCNEKLRISGTAVMKSTKQAAKIKTKCMQLKLCP